VGILAVLCLVASPDITWAAEGELSQQATPAEGEVGSRATPMLRQELGGPLLKAPALQGATTPIAQPWIKVNPPSEFHDEWVPAKVSAGGFAVGAIKYEVRDMSPRTTSASVGVVVLSGVPVALPDGTLGIPETSIRVSGLGGIGSTVFKLTMTASDGRIQEAVIPFELKPAMPNPVAIPMPSWSRATSDGAQRFVLLGELRNWAVLDQETGLVWERSPSQTSVSWIEAKQQCMRSRRGGRMGWRLPSITEMSTLYYCQFNMCKVPDPHPFTDIGPLSFWSATTEHPAGEPVKAWTFGFNFSLIDAAGPARSRFWCVRGPGGEQE